MDHLDVGLLLIVATIAGGIATLAGFGIGSLLTPLLAWQLGAPKLAVAAVSIPHFIATALRFWRLRGHTDRRVLLSFGSMSAVGGLIGALLHVRLSSTILTIVLGVLLIFAGIMGLTGLAQKMRFGGALAWIAGAVSGAFGGLVGNQGGIRSAALLTFDLRKEAFIATATAIGLIVDAVRMPVYFVVAGQDLRAVWPWIAVATAGVVVGTLLGERVLRHIPQPIFHRLVAGIILALGVAVIAQAMATSPA